MSAAGRPLPVGNDVNGTAILVELKRSRLRRRWVNIPVKCGFTARNEVLDRVWPKCGLSIQGEDQMAHPNEDLVREGFARSLRNSRTTRPSVRQVSA